MIISLAKHKELAGECAKSDDSKALRLETQKLQNSKTLQLKCYCRDFAERTKVKSTISHNETFQRLHTPTSTFKGVFWMFRFTVLNSKMSAFWMFWALSSTPRKPRRSLSTSEGWRQPERKRPFEPPAASAKQKNIIKYKLLDLLPCGGRYRCIRVCPVHMDLDLDLEFSTHHKSILVEMDY